jgi:hypothetical protein
MMEVVENKTFYRGFIQGRKCRRLESDGREDMREGMREGMER